MFATGIDKSQLNVPMYYYEKFEDTKGVIRNRKLKDRQHNGQKKKRQKDNQRSTNFT